MDSRKSILVLGNRRHYYGLGKGFKVDMFLEQLREELSRQHDVLCWGWGYRYHWRENRHLSEVVDFFGKPDIILTDSLDDYTWLGMQDIDAVKVHIIGDFYPKMNDRPFSKSIQCFEQYDVLLATCNTSLLLAEEHLPEKKCVFWPFSVDTNFFRNYDRYRPIDVFFGASSAVNIYGPDRKLIEKTLGGMQREGFNIESGKRHYYGDYVDYLNASKIGVSNNFKHGFMTKKVLEIMSCGALALTDRCEEFDMVGIKNGEHVVIYDDLDDLREKIYYYLANDYRREEIAFNGYNMVLSKFSMRDAAHRLVEIVSNVDINA